MISTAGPRQARHLSEAIGGECSLQDPLHPARTAEELYRSAFNSLSLAMLYVASSGRAMCLNSRAQKLLRGDNNIELDQAGQIRTTDLVAAEKLRAILQTPHKAPGHQRPAAHDRILIRRGPDIRRPLSLSLIPVAGDGSGCCGFTAYIVDPEHPVAPDRAALAANFGLTRAEIKVVQALCAGMTLAEYSVSAGVTIGTARTVLKRVFGKTDTHHQAGLVALVLRYAGIQAE